MRNIFRKIARAKTATKIVLLLSGFIPGILAYILNSNLLMLIAVVYGLAVYIPIQLSSIAPPKD